MKVGKNEAKMLIVAPKAALGNALSVLFSELNISVCDTAQTADEARKLFSCKNYDIVLIDPPVAGDSFTTLAIDMGKTATASVMVLLPAEFIGSSLGLLSANGIMAMPKAYDLQSISVALSNLIAMHNRLSEASLQALSLKNKMEEIKLVNRAKLLLMQKLKMTESDAHRYIEKCAMDNSLKRRDIAENIIKTYEK